MLFSIVCVCDPRARGVERDTAILSLAVLKFRVRRACRFYAPWCGHCKTLGPKMKAAAKKLSELGVSIGAVDVEPNRNVQAMFSDIRGFPTLKFVKNPTGKGSVNFDGARESEAIVQFSKEQAAKF